MRCLACVRAEWSGVNGWVGASDYLGCVWNGRSNRLRRKVPPPPAISGPQSASSGPWQAISGLRSATSGPQPAVSRPAISRLGPAISRRYPVTFGLGKAISGPWPHPSFKRPPLKCFGRKTLWLSASGPGPAISSPGPAPFGPGQAISGAEAAPGPSKGLLERGIAEIPFGAPFECVIVHKAAEG